MMESLSESVLRHAARATGRIARHYMSALRIAAKKKRRPPVVWNRRKRMDQCRGGCQPARAAPRRGVTRCHGSSPRQLRITVGRRYGRILQSRFK